jgi:tetratricopeptide (TPR) repeat protein
MRGWAMPVYKFSPNLASLRERRETFVGREAILEDLLARVRNIGSGARHCILIGPRGIGKTHLLLLLADSIGDDEALASQWMVVRFAEEEYSITSLVELLLGIVESLPDGQSRDIGRDVDLALGRILDFSAASGKRLLLLMDNIQLYFNRFPDTDIGRMRDILMSNSTFLVIGGAPSYFKQMTGYEEPFYNFFEPIHLAELRPEEVEEMLRRRAEFEGARKFLEEFEECRPKIRATAHLTGGNPRLILMLYQVMCESGVVEAAEAFTQLLDDLTPYFQGRMEGLPPQGGKVLDTLASMEGPSTSTELAEVAGMSVNTVTTYIKRLRYAGFIRQEKRRRSRSTRYEVTDRLFRMWREMRTETGRARLGLIIRFLELWYTPVELLGETGKLLTRLGEAQEGEKPQLLMHLGYLKEAAPDLLRSEVERAYLYAEAGRLELAAAEIAPLKDLASCDEDVKADPDDADAWVSRGAALGELDRHQEALENFRKAIELQPDLATAWTGRGAALGNLGRYEEALESFYKAVRLRPDYATAWTGRGMALRDLGRYEEALESFDRAVQLQPDLAAAWNNRGLALLNLGRHDEALESMKRTVELGKARGLEDIPEFAALVAAATELLASLRSLTEDNLGSARRALKNAIENGKQADKGSFQLLLFGYLKGALKSGKTQFVQEAIEIIVSELGEEYGELLSPFDIALEYMRTKDVGILERLHQEVRELVLEIAEQAKPSHIEGSGASLT